MKQAMSCGYASKAARACRSDSCSSATISTPGATTGASIRGQSNFGKRATLLGSVLVSDMVYPLRPWKAPRRCSTRVPSAGSIPRDSPSRLFQSNATLSAFSTASAPPSTKNRCGSAGSPSTRANVCTKRAIGTEYTSELLGLFTAACASSARKAGSVNAGWFIPSADDAKNVNISRYRLPSRASTR